MSEEGSRIGVASGARIVIFAVGLGVSTALRWVRFFPNNDPIMAVTLPYARRGRVSAVLFPVAAMALFDLLSGRIGIWTLVTAGTYGLIGFGFSFLYAGLAARGRRVGRGTYLLSGAAGVLVFDFVTGPVLSSALFHLSFAQAAVGQVPFTLRHLLSVSLYAVLVSPVVDWTLDRVERGERALQKRLARASRAT